MATLFRPFGTRNALIDSHEWSRMVKDFGRTFKNVAGKPTVLLSNSGMDFDVFRKRLERKHPISKAPPQMCGVPLRTLPHASHLRGLWWNALFCRF